MNVFVDDDLRPDLGGTEQQTSYRFEYLGPSELRLHRLNRRVTGIHGQEMPEVRQRGTEVRAETEDTTLDLLDDRAVRIGLFESERTPKEADQGMEGDRAPERHRASLDPSRSLADLPLKFQEEARLSDPGLPDDEHHLSEAGDDLIETFRQHPKLTVATDEWCQPAFSLDVKTGSGGARRNDLPRTHRLSLSLERKIAEGPRVEIVANETVRRLGDDDASGNGDLQHPGRDIRRVANRRVVHPQVVADATDDNEAGVEALPNPKLDTAALFQFVPITLEGL